MSESKVTPVGAAVPADVVVSTGPGLEPGQPVQGGTEDVQLLAWDPIARRWSQTFDAATKVVSPELLGANQPGAVPPSAPEPLLDQSHPVSDVWVHPVQMTQGHPLLLVYGVDAFTNHAPGVLGLITLPAQGTPEVTYYATHAGMGRPVIEGAAGQQRVSIRAGYFTATDAMCCPIRDFTQVLGPSPNDFATTSTVQVVEDNRPWLGAYVVTDTTTPGTVIVVGTAPSSPASAVLHVADRIVGVTGSPPLTSSGSGPGVLDDIAKHQPGDTVSLSVSRSGSPLHIPVNLASLKDAGYPPDNAPQAAVIDVTVGNPPAGQPAGAIINTVADGGPGAVAGLQPGDEITAAGLMPVHSFADLQVALMGTAGQTLNLTVRKPDGTSQSVTITPTTPPSKDYNVLQASAI